MTLSTKLFLRITLTLIGCAALTGVLAALGMVGSHGGQVGTTCAVAFGVVFSAWCARNKFSQPHTRPAELLFAGGLALTMLLAVIAIWLPESLRQSDSRGESAAFKFGMSSVCFYVASLVGSTVFAAWKIPTLRFASRAGTGVVGVVLVLLLAAIWGTHDLCFKAGLIVAPFGLALSLSLVGLGHERRHWRWVGFGAALLLMAWSLLKLDSPRGFWGHLWDNQPWYVAGCCVVAGSTYALLMARPPLRPSQEWLRKITFGTVALVLAFISGAAFYGHDSETLFRLIVASSILAACGTLTVLILSRFSRPVEVPADQAITHMLVACPRCQERQMAPLGSSPCMRCRAVLTVGCAEPLCGHCHAPVWGVMGNACPRCGGALPARGVALPPAECA